MNRNIILLVLSIIVYFSTGCNSKIEDKEFIDQNFSFAISQYKKLTAVIVSEETPMPRTISEKDSSIVYTNIKDWTSGFFPGSLWYLYEYTQDEYWKNQAEKYTDIMAPIQFYSSHHDIGFMINCSYGNAYRLTGDERYKQVFVNSAKSLSSRFIENAGVIRSWDYKKSWSGVDWHCPVIIDNMMNLELLFKASEITGNEVYSKIAISHADATINNHIRDDFSCYHVVNYDTINGTITDKATWQGFSDNSMWARGQAWAVYGFTMVYRATKDMKYLEVAKNMADAYLNHPQLPDDMIPIWDFNVNQPGYDPPWKYDQSQYSTISRDASAAAIMASALLELCTYQDNNNKYLTAAKKMLKSLSQNYKTDPSTQNYFLLDKSVGNFPKGYEIDVPIIYADYYYLEALLRYKSVKNI